MISIIKCFSFSCFTVDLENPFIEKGPCKRSFLDLAPKLDDLDLTFCMINASDMGGLNGSIQTRIS